MIVLRKKKCQFIRILDAFFPTRILNQKEKMLFLIYVKSTKIQILHNDSYVIYFLF